jgi:hypothetical protein
MENTRLGDNTATAFGHRILFSKKRLALAFAIAALSDVIGAFVTLAVPVAWALDVVTALLLFVVLGWQWLLLPGLILEAIPGVGVLPFWLLVVAGIAIWGTLRPNLKWFKKGENRIPPRDRQASRSPLVKLTYRACKG